MYIYNFFDLFSKYLLLFVILIIQFQEVFLKETHVLDKRSWVGFYIILTILFIVNMLFSIILTLVMISEKGFKGFINYTLNGEFLHPKRKGKETNYLAEFETASTIMISLLHIILLGCEGYLALNKFQDTTTSVLAFLYFALVWIEYRIYTSINISRLIEESVIN